MADVHVPLRPYQEQTKNFILTHRNSGIFLSMGLGKTVSTLAALQQGKPKGHILVIAPLNIAKLTWPNEIKEWGFQANTKSFILNEKNKKLTPLERNKLFKESLTSQSSIYFINKELVIKLIDWMEENSPNYWPFQTVIIDESQSFKNPSSKSFKALAKIRDKVRHMILLSGTPTPESLDNLWSQIYLLDGGQALGSTISEYRNTYFYESKHIGAIPVKWEPYPGSKEIIYDKIKHLVMSLENTVIQLPEIIYQPIFIDLPTDKLQEYKNFQKESILEVVLNDLYLPQKHKDIGNDTSDIDNEDIEPWIIEALNGGVLRNKLLQFASGTIYVNEEKEYAIVHDGKIEALKALIPTLDSPALIAYKFKSDKNRIYTELQKEGFDVHLFDGSQEMLKKWNNGEIPLMMIHPASAGHGLNLQFGGCNLIWYTLPDSAEHWLQTNKRLHRPGQKNTVTIWMLLTNNTWDMKMPAMLDKKTNDLDQFMDAVRIDKEFDKEIQNEFAEMNL